LGRSVRGRCQGGVFRAACDSSGVRPLFCVLRNESSERARRRRPGARCRLDQEPVCLVGVTHHRPATRLPCIRPASPDATSKRRIGRGACRRTGVEPFSVERGSFVHRRWLITTMNSCECGRRRSHGSRLDPRLDYDSARQWLRDTIRSVQQRPSAGRLVLLAVSTRRPHRSYLIAVLSPRRFASCLREFTPSLRNTFRRWYSTVLGLMNS
jgi:hypothetical protein